MNSLIVKMTEGQDLTEEESSELLEAIIAGVCTPPEAALALSALRTKGESIAEISGFIKTMRAHMTRVHVPGAVDMAGTGGDGSGTFNISTAASFVVAGAGETVGS